MDTEIVRGVFPAARDEFVVQYTKTTPVRVRRALLVCGVQGSVKFLVHNNSASNMRRALMERVYNVEVNGHLQRPPQPAPGIFATLAGPRETLMRHLPCITPMSRTSFVLSRPADKRKIYERGLQSLHSLPVGKRDARVTGAFVKAEKVNAKKGDPAPRLIQPRTPRYNIEVGRYLAPAEHHIYKAIDTMWGGPTVMKGYNAVGIAQNIADAWQEFSDPVALGLDASRFDQHVSAAALRFEHTIYNGIFQSAELRRLLRWQIDNHGVGRADDSVFIYRKRGSRMSGDMNTALGNIILMTLMVYYYCQVRGVRARLINNGDDCTLICNRTDILTVLDGLHDWFLQYGFNIVQEPVVDVMERIEFCQMRPVHVNGQWTMVRNLHNSLTKDALCIKARTADGLRSWLHCVGRSGLAMASGVPVQQAYYQWFCDHGCKGKRLAEVEDLRSGLAVFSKGMVAIATDITPATRVSFFRAFGMHPSEQIALETMYAQLEAQLDAPTSTYYNLLNLIDYYG